MRIDESKRLLLSDTLVPDIFILEYLPELSGLAVKCYLFLLLTARARRQISQEDLGRRLNQAEDQIQAVLVELHAAGLIVLQEDLIELTDIKAAEIERTWRRRTAADPAADEKTRQRLAKRESLLQDISRTFFQGLMSPSWYGEIDNWFDRYSFEPEVVYALFQECARGNKLGSKGYIAAVADSWAQRGIVSFADLNQYFLSQEKINQLSRKIGRKLRRKMTEYDDAIISRWLEQFGYEFEIIELALQKITRASNPNLNFVDKILQEWFEHQLHDPAAIKAYEEQKRAQFNKEKSWRFGGQAKGPASFEQRSYTDDDLAEFYEPLEVPPPAAAQDPAEEVDLADLMARTENEAKDAEELD